MPNYTPVLHSVSYLGAWPGQTFLSCDDFLAKAVSLGFPAVALVAKSPHVSPFEYSKRMRTELRAKIDGAGLQLAALMGYTDFTCGMRRAGIPSAEMNAGYVAQLSQLCADLGCDRLRIFTGYRHHKLPYDAQYGEVVKGLRLAANAARDCGITLLLQNHHDIAAHYKEFAWLLAELDHPNVKAAFDCWAPWLQGARGDELRQSVTLLKPWLSFTTVADYKVMPQFTYHTGRVHYQPSQPSLVRATSPGNGELDYHAFFAGLRDIDYEGYITYEMCAPLEGGGGIENLDQTARNFLAFLQEKAER